MTPAPRLTISLTPLDTAIRLLLDGVAAVDAIDVSSDAAIGSVAADMPPLQDGIPKFNIATIDGWALRARDIVGASSYSPLPLPVVPRWVEAGECLPDGCDCVLDADLAEHTGALFQILAEVNPGHGVRRPGGDLAAGQSILAAGQRVSATDLLAIRAAGVDWIKVRKPLVHVIDVPSTDGSRVSSQFICEFIKAHGANVSLTRAGARDAPSIAAALGSEPSDLVAIVGGTGFGRTDATIAALASGNVLVAHGLAVQPGRTAAIGKIVGTPIIAIPGAADQAVAIGLMLVQPLLDKLSGRAIRTGVTRSLAQKISSAIGVDELVFLKELNGGWMPLAIGELSLNAIVVADAWHIVPADSEGYAVATALEAFPLRETI